MCTSFRFVLGKETVLWLFALLSGQTGVRRSLREGQKLYSNTTEALQIKVILFYSSATTSKALCCCKSSPLMVKDSAYRSSIQGSGKSDKEEASIYIEGDECSNKRAWFAGTQGGFLFVLKVGTHLADMKETWQSSQLAASTPGEQT